MVAIAVFSFLCFNLITQCKQNYKVAWKPKRICESSRAYPGLRDRRYVEEHFLLPDRIADSLMAINMTVNGAVNKKIPAECIISFHPWFKLSKRRGG